MSAALSLLEPAAVAALRILRVMPHGHPMRLVDRIEDGADEVSAIAYKNLSFTEPCYRDLDACSEAEALAYPLSLLLESFGQGAGLLLAKRGFLEQAGSSCAVVFGQFEDIEILGHAYPGECLRHEVRLEQLVGRLAVLSGHSWVGQRPIARHGSLKAFLTPVATLARGAAA